MRTLYQNARPLREAAGESDISTAKALYKKAMSIDPGSGDAYAALLAGRIDAIAYDRPPLDYAATQNDKYVVLPWTVGETSTPLPYLPGS